MFQMRTVLIQFTVGAEPHFIDQASSHHLQQQHQQQQQQRQRRPSFEIKRESDNEPDNETFAAPAKKVKRLDFGPEVRSLNLPEKKKDELLELDDRTRMLRIVNAFSEEQVDRYELFRRSCFPRQQIKRLMQQVGNTQVNNQVVIAMAGVAKVFVGELVEEGLRVAEERKYEGALLPSHIREAVRRLSNVEGSNCFDKCRKRRRPF